MSFCKDSFWNTTEIWDTDNPNFTSCFRNTLLPSLPCGFLWLAAPFWLSHLKRHNSKLVPKAIEKEVSLASRLTFIFCSKILLTLVLIVNISGELISRTQDAADRDEDASPSDMFYGILLLLTFALLLAITVYEKKRCFRTSPPATLFWVTLLITSIPTFKYDVELW